MLDEAGTCVSQFPKKAANLLKNSRNGREIGGQQSTSWTVRPVL